MTKGQLYIEEDEKTYRIILITGKVKGLLLPTTSYTSGVEKVPAISCRWVAGPWSPRPRSFNMPCTFIERGNWKKIKPKDLALHFSIPNKTILFDKILSQQYKRLDYSE